MNRLLPSVEVPQAEPLFDPMSPSVIADPYPLLPSAADASIRSTARRLGFFVVSWHADVSFVLRDKCFGKDFVGRMTRRFGAAGAR